MFYLPHFECLELFCRIVAKAEGGTPLEKFKSHSFIESKINASKQLAFTKSITTCINEVLIDKQKGLDALNKLSVPTLGAKTIYELCKCVRLRLPFNISESDLIALNLFLEDETYSIHKQEKADGVPSRREWALIGTKWTLYHFEEKLFKTNSTSIEKPRISVSSVEFDMFNRVMIQSPSAKNTAPDDYLGRYEIRHEEFLVMQLVTKGGNLKRLRIELTIGRNDNFNLVLGQYHNLDSSIYSGTLILIKEQENSVRIPKHVSFSDRKKSDEIPDYVWRYLENKRMNQLRSPSEIFTAENLIDWMDLKAKEKK